MFKLQCSYSISYVEEVRVCAEKANVCVCEQKLDLYTPGGHLSVCIIERIIWLQAKQSTVCWCPNEGFVNVGKSKTSPEDFEEFNWETRHFNIQGELL